MSPTTWDILCLVAALLVVAGSFYYYVVGIHFGDRALSRLAVLAFLVFGAAALVFFVRIVI